MQNSNNNDGIRRRVKNIPGSGFGMHGLLCAVLAIILAVNLSFGYSAYSKAVEGAPEDGAYSSISLLMNVIQIIRQNYVESDKVGYENLIHGALKGMLHELDPFSAYMEPKNYSDMIGDAEGREFGGVGIHISVKNNVLTVIAPMEGTPAFDAGIKPGDAIIEINGNATRNMSLHECIKQLKGDPGSKVQITIYRESEDRSIGIELERAQIEVPTVHSAIIPEEEIGYLRITQFNVSTAEQMDEAIEKLGEKGCRAMVIDLRGNPGGLLQSAVEVCSRFIPRGEMIVFTEGRTPAMRQEFRAGQCHKTDWPIVILVNGNSASAAEIMSGCLQDHKRAVLVGEQTFGKGSVQTVIPLPDKSALRLTTAKYYTPSERVIHEHGIDPNIPVSVSRQTELILYSQRVAYPGIVKPEARDTVRDIQLERAIEVLKGIMLFNASRIGEG